MHGRTGVLLISVIAFLVGLGWSSPADSQIEPAAIPSITAFSPAGGPAGTLVNLSGSGFTGATAVRFNGRSTSFSVTTDAQITATVPSGATTGPISVTTPGGTGTSSTSFYVGSAPTLTSFAPGYGPVGTVVSITGTNFTGALAVRFGGHDAAFTVNSATQIDATVPAGAVTGTISVVNPAGTGTSSSTFYLPPVITGFSPAGGPFGSQVYLFGTGFAIAQSVVFNGTGASFSIDSDSQIRAAIPNEATTGPLSVTSPAGVGSSGLDFFVGSAPTISSFSPQGGPVGTEVTIQGSGFVGVTDVTLGGVFASYVVDGPTQLRATVPPGATTGAIAVTNPSGTGTSAGSFFVGATPQIVSLTPPFGPVGIPVTITGSGFTGVTSLNFNGTSTPFTVVDDGTITTTVPSGARTGPVHISNQAGTATSASFGVAPTVDTFDPSYVPSLNRATTTIAITGANFTGATSVRFNDVETQFTIGSDTQISASIPLGDVNGPISVSTPYGTAVSAGTFRLIDLVPPPRTPGHVWPHGIAENVPAAQVAAGDQTPLVSVVDGVGGVIEVWQDTRNGEPDIYAQRITIYGEIAPGWPNDGLPVCNASGSQTQPVAVADGAGGVLIAWTDWRSGNSDIYAQHLLSDGTREATWPVNGLVVCANPSSQSSPSIASDGAGGAIIAWEDSRRGEWDVFAQRLTAIGSIPAGWAADGIAICNVGGAQYGPLITSDGNGGALVAWRDQRWSTQVFVERVRGDGQVATGWSGGGSPASDYCCSQYIESIAPDGAGGAWVGWRDDRCYSNIMVQHFTPSGSRVFGDGMAMNQYCRYGTRDELRLLPDGSGGIYVAWTERQDYGQAEIALQRFSNSGVAAGWPTYGLRLTNEGSDQTSPELASDGSGGVIVTWQDVRFGNWDVFAGRATSGGTLFPAWPVNGSRICVAANTQTEPTVVSSQNGAVLISWPDSRSGQYRVFTQYVDGAGRLGNVEPEIQEAKDLPDDQGGQVRVKWNASYLDVLPTLEIGAYGIWREVPTTSALKAIASGARLVRGVATANDAQPGVYRVMSTATTGTYWVGVGSILARGMATYTFVAPTLADSTALGNPLTNFMVDAHAAFIPYFWSSVPLPGYSVDNLPPGPPQGFGADLTTGGVGLHWQQNPEHDLAGYKIYRGASPDFVMDDGSFLAAVTATAYTDPTGSSSLTYKVVAVDIHGNTSGESATQPPPVGIGAPIIPSVLTLEPPRPNPAVGSCAIRMGFPRSSEVSLTVLDVSGRLVRHILTGKVQPGMRTVVWDGRDDEARLVSSGVYLYRLDDGTKKLTRRLVFVR